MTEAKLSAKIPAVVLGATGAVGQRLVSLLVGHPWFKVVGVAASERSAGRSFADACHWVLSDALPGAVARMMIAPLDPDAVRCERPAVAFSALPAEVARQTEPAFAEAGFAVCSNASAHRETADVPLLIPEVNPDHLALLDVQRAERGWPGLLVTNPNCSTTGIALAVKALDEAFGLRQAVVCTLQAVSGAGYPGVASLDILGNVIPWIPTEETKIERETRILLGRVKDGRRVDADIVVSAHAHRVPVVDGHTFAVSLGFDQTPSPQEAGRVLGAFCGVDSVRRLPSAPVRPVRVFEDVDRPQPRLDLAGEGGMRVGIGRIRPCPLLDLRMVGLVHNTQRGAAAGAILNAEFLVAEGWLR